MLLDISGGPEEFTQCTECGDIAVVKDRYTNPSTDGPIEHRVTVCPSRHFMTAIG